MEDSPQARGSTRARPWLRIGSWDELLKHEEQIVERINSTPKGGNLFLANPFMLLADIGVELSEEARKEIMRREKHLSALSPVPYNALKSSEQEQKIHIRLHGLFRRGLK